MIKTLAELADKHNTDKGYKHNYIPYYEKYFKKFRDKEISLLELGISQGSSLLMWKEYFTKGNIIGMDIFEGDHYEGKVNGIKNKLKENDIKFVVGSQTDLEAINKVTKKVSNKSIKSIGFDIIIDDASHRPYDQQISMIFLLPWIKNGGYYVIEDLNYRCDPSESTLSVIKKFQKTGKWQSPFLTKIQNRRTGESINEIKLHRNDKIAFIS